MGEALLRLQLGYISRSVVRMTDENLKITDKRMFTPEGELREEYRHLADDRPDEEEPRQEPSAADGAEAPGSEQPAAEAPATRASAADTAEEPPAAADPEPPAAASGSSEPRREPSPQTPGVTFFDLVGVLAEPASIYLRQAQEPGDQRAQSLQLAKVHIDLLDLLREKTSGELEEAEDQMLEDVLYRLRLAYVQVKREMG
jgi:hypothetical protein